MAGTRGPGRSLHRSRSHRMIAGVCGGIGEYADVDPNVIRVLLALLCVIGGSGFALYLVGWVLLPDEGSDVSLAQKMFRR